MRTRGIEFPLSATAADSPPPHPLIGRGFGCNGRIAKIVPAELLLFGNPDRKRRMAAARDRAAKLRCRKKNPAQLLVLGGNPRRNGAAEELYEDFQGREPSGVLEYDETQDMPRKAAVLGDLVAIGFGNVTDEGEVLHGDVLAKRWAKCSHISFAGDDVKLAGNGGRTQLYCVGGEQMLSKQVLETLHARGGARAMYLGPATFIVYETRKSSDSFEGGQYCHEFAEEGGRRPTVYYDSKAQRILIRGGSYVIEDRGIVN